jgi:two-component SAPR family response regulator
VQLVASVQAVTRLLDGPADADAQLAAATVLMRHHTGNLDSDNATAIERSAAGYAASRTVTPFNRASWLVEFARSLALRLDHAGALNALDEASGLVSNSALAPVRGRLAQVRHLVYLATGDHAAMCSHIEVMRSQLVPSRPFEMSVLQSALSDDARLRGRIAQAVAHARSAVEFADHSGCRQERVGARIRCAAMLVVAGLDDQAMACLDAARALDAPTARQPMLRDLLLIEASLALRGKTPEAVGGVLERALTAPGEYPASTMFMVHPVLMSKLCAEGLRLGVESECIRQLIGRHRLVPPSTDAQAWPWPVRIYTLGGFEVLRDDVQIRFKGKTQKRPLELLQALIAHGGNEVAVNTLAEALWPDAEGDAAYHALENALYRLRQLLGFPAALTLSNGRLSLDPQHCWVDVWAFERRVAEASGADTQPGPATDEIMALYRGHFLDQEGQSWALPMRERLRDKIVRHVRGLAQSYERTQVWSNAASVYQRGLELDNLAEDLYRGLMVCHRELGNYAEAIKVYRRCRELLSIVLGARPTDETDAVYATLRRA